MDWVNKVLNTVIALIAGIVGILYIPASVDTFCNDVSILITIITGKVVTLPDLSAVVCIVFTGYVVFAVYAVWVWPDNPHNPNNPHNRQSR